MTDFDSADRTGPPKQTKVGRLIAEYGLGDVGAELEQRWTGEDGERDSLRTLADVFNRRMLERAMTDAGMDPLDGEVQNVYRLLTADEVSSGTRTETRARLRREGVDVETLVGDFVTYQAIRTYLKDVRDASYDRDDSGGPEAARSAIDRLIGRTTAVVEQKLRQLQSRNGFSLGTFSVQATVMVYCEGCETQYEVTALLRRGGCDCAATDLE